MPVPATSSIQKREARALPEQAGKLPRIIATTDGRDRHGDVIVPDGVRLQVGTPILWAHDVRSLPVGRVERVYHYPNRVEVEFSWLQHDERADRVRNAYSQHMCSGSIGFLPLTSPVRDGAGFRYENIEVTELSIVPTPANVECVPVLRRLGFLDEEPVFEVDEAQVLALIRATIVNATLTPAERRQRDMLGHMHQQEALRVRDQADLEMLRILNPAPIYSFQA